MLANPPLCEFASKVRKCLNGGIKHRDKRHFHRQSTISPPYVITISIRFFNNFIARIIRLNLHIHHGSFHRAHRSLWLLGGVRCLFRLLRLLFRDRFHGCFVGGCFHLSVFIRNFEAANIFINFYSALRPVAGQLSLDGADFDILERVWERLFKKMCRVQIIFYYCPLNFIEQHKN